MYVSAKIAIEPIILMQYARRIHSLSLFARAMKFYHRNGSKMELWLFKNQLEDSHTFQRTQIRCQEMMTHKHDF